MMADKAVVTLGRTDFEDFHLLLHLLLRVGPGSPSWFAKETAYLGLSSSWRSPCEHSDTLCPLLLLLPLK